MPFRLRLLAGLLPLLLAGCYVSKQPFITPATADYPIQAPAHFDAFLPRGTQWRPQPGRTLQRVGTHYTYVEDGSTRRSPPFLLKRIAPNRYVLQMSDTSNVQRVSEYYYALVQFDGTSATQFKPACAPRVVWVEEKSIDKVERLSTGDRCLFSSLEKLSTVLQEASVNAAPEARFVLSKTSTPAVPARPPRPK